MGLPEDIKVQTGKNHETCKDKCKLCHINQTGQSKHEKKSVSNLNCMQDVGFEQTFTKFSETFIPKEYFLYRKKTQSKPSQWPSLIVPVCVVLAGV